MCLFSVFKPIAAVVAAASRVDEYFPIAASVYYNHSNISRINSHTARLSSDCNYSTPLLDIIKFPGSSYIMWTVAGQGLLHDESDVYRRNSGRE